MSGLVVVLVAVLAAQQPSRNIWEAQYKSRTPEQMAAQFENESRPVFRHRHQIVALLDLKPGQTVAEIGAGSGFLSRLIAAGVGPSGRAIATELDAKMVAYMNDRAGREGLATFRAIVGQPRATGLQASSANTILIVNTFSFFDRPEEMLQSIRTAMAPGGLLTIVDFPKQEGGIEAEVVLALVTNAGFVLLDRSDAIPGHYSLRFKKQVSRVQRQSPRDQSRVSDSERATRTERDLPKCLSQEANRLSECVRGPGAKPPDQY